MPTREQVSAVAALLEGLSDAEVRELCIQALRSWHRKAPSEIHFQMHGHLGREFLALVAERKGASDLDTNSLKEVFLLGTEVEQHPTLLGILEFVDWFVHAGFATPLPGLVNQYPITIRVTRSGLRFLDRSDDHPLLPGFVGRLESRCPSLPDDVVALWVDARSCLDHQLLRPTVVLIGVAYEVAVEAVVEHLVSKQHLPSTVLEKRAAVRISEVRAIINTLVPGATSQEREHRFAVHAAYDFADQLRRRRNDASHTMPRYGFDDRDEVEELVVSAGRHLPALWSLTS